MSTLLDGHSPSLPTYSVSEPKVPGGSWEFRIQYVSGAELFGSAPDRMEADRCALEIARLTRAANVLRPGQTSPTVEPDFVRVRDPVQELIGQAVKSEPLSKYALKSIERAVQKQVTEVEALKRERAAQRFSQKHIRSQSDFLQSLSRRKR